MRLTHPFGGVRPRLPSIDGLLAGLTPEQAQAVKHGEGPLLLLAGPGAGKTRTLTHRAAYLIATRRARPGEILAVTFSVRAAAELRLRLVELLGESVAGGVTTATFHSVCARLLRAHAGVFGRTERYTIYDQGDMRHVLERLLSAPAPGVRAALCDHGRPGIAELVFELSRAKNLLLTPDSYVRSASHPAAPLIAVLWRESQAELRRSDAMDFDDLLAFGVRLLADDPHRLRWLRRRWRWILCEEFQTQATPRRCWWTSLPAGTGTCACDDDQLVHAWRHTDPNHILGFGERHPGHAQIVLARNFRSRTEILQAAVSCVSHNERRTPKTLSRCGAAAAG
jgi:DNA helicase-2/ATP-dependent DNA helicase PcrA